LFSDDDIVVIDKPAQLLSERGVHDRGPAVPEVLASQGYGRTFLVHRLDAGTSGVMVVARTKAAADHLSLAFKDGEMRKGYLLVCTGEPGAGAYDGPIRRDPEHPRRFCVHPQGKAA
jgi:23S rRNA pseudouridine1911/1915/1917 synthase